MIRSCSYSFASTSLLAASVTATSPSHRAIIIRYEGVVFSSRVRNTKIFKIELESRDDKKQPRSISRGTVVQYTHSKGVTRTWVLVGFYKSPDSSKLSKCINALGVDPTTGEWYFIRGPLNSDPKLLLMCYPEHLYSYVQWLSCHNVTDVWSSLHPRVLTVLYLFMHRKCTAGTRGPSSLRQ
jgi:hypothetical protein